MEVEGQEERDLAEVRDKEDRMVHLVAKDLEAVVVVAKLVLLPDNREALP